ncbi:MAG TPA: sulfur carrier protein ThiS [Bryobacterales bacterium]|nr:sulfur carrier protein ThiS [Bryobacterales bacterium]
MSTATTEVTIRLNGEAFQIPLGATLAELVRRLELAEDRVAVEVNRRIVRRPQWPETRIDAGASIEIVQIVGGG